MVARRIDTIDRVIQGDVLFDPETRRVALGVDAAAADDRVRRGLLHPTGPLFGARTPLATDAAGEVERDVVDAEHLDAARLASTRGLDAEGSRRPLRFLARELEMRPLADARAIEFAFALPPGCFATALIAELTKTASFPV